MHMRRLLRWKALVLLLAEARALDPKCDLIEQIDDAVSVHVADAASGPPGPPPRPAMTPLLHPGVGSFETMIGVIPMYQDPVTHAW